MTTHVDERKEAMVFRTEDGIVVPAVTADQMREFESPLGRNYWVRLMVEEEAA